MSPHWCLINQITAGLPFSESLLPSGLKMADSGGFEPPTARFVAEYSIQLSYESANGGEGGIRTPDTLLRCTPLAGERLRPLGHLSATRGASYPSLPRLQSQKSD